MKRIVMIVLFCVLLQGTSLAVEIPGELWEALPEDAAELLGDTDLSAGEGLLSSMENILQRVERSVHVIFRQQIRSVAMILLVVVLCGVLDGFSKDAIQKTSPYISMVGGITVTLLTVGSLDSLIGLGAETIHQLNDFSKALLPTLATVAAAGGMVSGAAVRQVSAVFCVDLLLSLINGLLLPMLYLYIGMLTAATCLGEHRLQTLAQGMKRGITWLLTLALSAFTLYLSVVRVVSGTADSMAIKMTKTVISSVVPVVGGIISDASETLLAGAGVIRHAVGLFGLLGILAVCALPFARLGLQYLLYKAAGFAAEIVGTPELCKLLDGLGGAFGLMLGMTGACALLLLVAILAAAAMTAL